MGPCAAVCLRWRGLRNWKHSVVLKLLSSRLRETLTSFKSKSHKRLVTYDDLRLKRQIPHGSSTHLHHRIEVSSIACDQCRVSVPVREALVGHTDSLHCHRHGITWTKKSRRVSGKTNTLRSAGQNHSPGKQGCALRQKCNDLSQTGGTSRRTATQPSEEFMAINADFKTKGKETVEQS